MAEHRILQAMAGARHGGAELFFERLVIALHRAGVPQHVLIRQNPERAGRLRAAGIEPVELPFGGPLDVRTRLGFRRELRRFRPDIVLSWMNRATAFCPRGAFTHVGRLGGYYDLKYYRHCDHLIGNTEDIVDYLHKGGWSRDRIHYLPNFVNAERMAPAARKPLYTPEQAPLVFALGRLHENKGFDVLLNAIARLPDCYLWLAGEGPLRGPLEEQAHRLGIKPRVRFLGWRDDVPALFAACDLFVCPSRHEPLGNVVIEAWAQERPVLATNSSGPAALIEQDETGVLVPIDDERAMADGIKWLMRDGARRRRLAAAGEEAFRTTFTEEAVIGAYLEFFDRIAGPPGSGGTQ